MTLVLASKIEGVPVLIGDFLLTEEGPTSRNFLPTRATVGGNKRPPPPRLLSKKVHKISDGFVLGFTGRTVPGRVLVNSILTRFKGVTPSVSELQSFLHGLRFDGIEHTEIVGWICAKSWTCFRWQGKAPELLTIEDQAIAGSGASHFSSHFNPATSSDREGVQTAVDHAIYKAICKIGKVLTEEIRRGTNLDHYYGFGGEVLFWNGAKFSYVDDVAYCFWNVLVDERNNLLVSPSDIFIRYRALNESSVMQVNHLQKTNIGLAAANTFVLAIPALHEHADEELQRLPPEAALWCTTLSIQNPSLGLAGTLYLVSEGTRDGLARYRDGRLELDIGTIREKIMEAKFFR